MRYEIFDIEFYGRWEKYDPGPFDSNFVQAGWSRLQIGLGNFLRTGWGQAATGIAAGETGLALPSVNGRIVSTATDLIDSVSTWQRVKGGQQGYVVGDSDAIFTQITRGANQVGNGVFRTADGTYIQMSPSTRTGIDSIRINTGQSIYKIRVEPELSGQIPR